MELPDAIGAVVRARVNHERARAFPYPVLQAMDPDALPVGYSIESVDGEDVQVEANHLLLSTINSSHPIAFAIRSRVASQGDSPDASLIAHAMDYVMTNGAEWAPDGQTPEALRRLHETLAEQEQHAVRIAIDGAYHDAIALDFDDSRALMLRVEDALVTIVGPRSVIDRGFATAND